LTFKILKNKKGNLVLISFVLIIFLVLIAAGINSLMIKSTLDVINDDVKDSLATTEGKDMFQYNTDHYAGWNDRAFIIVFLGYWLVCLVLAYLAPEHPLLTIVLILLVVILAGVGAYVSNIWDDLASNVLYSTARLSFPMTDFLLSHYVEELVLIGLSSAYIYYLSSSQKLGGL